MHMDIFDHIIYRSNLRGYKEPSTQIVENLSILRFLCTPESVCVWKCNSALEGSIQKITKHYYVGPSRAHSVIGKQRMASKTRMKFYVPTFYRELLLPDIHVNLVLPPAARINIPDDARKAAVRYNLDVTDDDFSEFSVGRHIDEDGSTVDPTSGWSDDDKEDTCYTQDFYTVRPTSIPRCVGALRGGQRLSDIAVIYMRLYPQVVRRIALGAEGFIRPLHSYEVRLLREICGRIAV